MMSDETEEEVMKKNVVAIILARGGSKGIPGKNLMPLGNRPLIAHTIGHAKKSVLVDRVILSTDDVGIASVARKFGAETPFLRPTYLATDTSPMISGLKHAVCWLHEQESYSADIVVMLKPTVVFREDDIVDRVIRCLLTNPDLDTVFAGYPTTKKYWRKRATGWEQLAKDIPQGLNRHDREPLYQEDHGVACATRAEVVLDTDHYIGKSVEIVEYSDERSFIDIDGFFDYWLAEQVLTGWNPIKDLPKPWIEEEVLYGGTD